jgi:dolichol-phosphate mannosyltransferase
MKLIVVMPVFNEEKSIELVINEWNEALQVILPDQFLFLIIDDGSNDKTQKILELISCRMPHLVYHSKDNRGHGISCLTGYHEALKHKPEWIFQIDSDYQCDPNYFIEFWLLRNSSKVIMGKRTKRLDGYYRLVITKIISTWLFMFTGKFCSDPNVPYRLIEANFLAHILPSTPPLQLSNSFLSYKFMERTTIKWVNINFRSRIHGNSFHKFIPTLFSILHLTKFLFHTKK